MIPAMSGDDTAPQASTVWIDLFQPDEGEIAQVESRYGVKVPDLAALAEIESSSRLRADGPILTMSVPMITGIAADRWDTAPTGFILTPEIFITVRYATLSLFDAVAGDLAKIADLTPSMAFVQLVEGAVDRAADHMEHAADTVGSVSQAIFFDDLPNAGLSKGTRILRETIRKLGRASDRASRVRYMFLSVGRMVTFVGDRCTPKLSEEINDRLAAITHDITSLDEFETSLTGRIQLLQDAATGFISIEQNDVVKLLTVASVVGIPPVLVVGIYGMNFKQMPELNWTYGYPFALLLCVVTAAVPYLWFKWRDWI
jgi:magnesium transporter